MAKAPAWWQGPPGTWGATAAKATGMVKYVARKRTVVPVPEQYKDLPIPWITVGYSLPVGAYTSLWPNSRGNDWTKVKPENWGSGWLPPGPLNPDGWEP